MPARFMLDTNICIYLRKRKPASVLARISQLDDGEACMSVITYGELRLWVEKHADRAKAQAITSELARVIDVAPLPQEAAEEYGRIRAYLQAKGEIIGGNDLWIAAHAKAAGLTLVSNNEGEFKRIPGLKLQNWAKV